jgi:hypothetical protein
MFRRDPAATEVGEIERGDPTWDHLADLVPVSHLKLDLPDQGDWHAYLTSRNIEIVPDAGGRASITAGACRMLIAEERQREQLRREKAAEAEKALVEADQLRRSQIWGGIPADQLPVGATPSSVMLAAAQADRPRRQSVLQHALSNSGEIEFHPIRDEGDAS